MSANEFINATCLDRQLGPYEVGSSEARNSYGSASQLACKRLLDIGIPIAAFVLLLPVLLVIAAAIKLDSPGPVFFRQRRWGLRGKVIEIYKFRSMHEDRCDPTGVEQTVLDDPRITRVGAFLRRSNLDELPQLFNVMLGQMSLVGPRCHAIGMKAGGVQYEELVPGYHRRHLVRPGLTGLAQVRGFRGPTDVAWKARARILSDIYYIENYSLLLDLKILGHTLWKELLGGSGF